MLALWVKNKILSSRDKFFHFHFQEQSLSLRCLRIRTMFLVFGILHFSCPIFSIFLLILTCEMCFENGLKGQILWCDSLDDQTHTLKMIQLLNSILLK